MSQLFSVNHKLPTYLHCNTNKLQTAETQQIAVVKRTRLVVSENVQDAVLTEQEEEWFWVCLTGISSYFFTSEQMSLNKSSYGFLFYFSVSGVLSSCVKRSHHHSCIFKASPLPLRRQSAHPKTGHVIQQSLEGQVSFFKKWFAYLKNPPQEALRVLSQTKLGKVCLRDVCEM